MTIYFSEPPVYLKDKPLDRALVVSDGRKGTVLDHIGPALDYWLENYSRDENWDGFDAGVWIWEGGILSTQDYFGEHDEELEGTARKLTDEEWEEFQMEPTCGPWDPADWIDPTPEDDPDLPQGFRALLCPAV